MQIIIGITKYSLQLSGYITCAQALVVTQSRVNFVDFEKKSI